MSLIYAGIGSRNTPEHILTEMTAFAEWAAFRNFTLSTGGAKGADSAFIDGAPEDMLHNWLPFNGYNGFKKAHSDDISEAAFRMAKKFHPNWKACDMSAMMMHARNCNIVMGKYLNRPVEFILCWTVDGTDAGGTGQALRLARHYDIPVINLGSGNYIAKIELLKENIVNALESPSMKMYDDLNLKRYYK